EAQELAEAEALFRLPVRVHGLAQQRDLGVAAGRQPADCYEDVVRPAAALAAPGEGDDAERAELVAALDDGDVGLEARSARDLPELVDRILLGELEPERLPPLRGGSLCDA